MKCPKCKTDNPDDSRFCNKCGNSLVEIPSTPTSIPTEEIAMKSALDFSPGQHFGKRYQIIEEIGSGGMGRVYKAVDKELNRIVALKMIRPEFSSHPGIVERFKKEIKLASQISHDNVCRIHDLGEIEEIKYISMQFIEGQNLYELTQTSKKLSVETAIHITAQICQALTAAHNKGVVHRDLKPQNIMLDKKGNAYVMDFGIARSLTAEEITKPGIVMGTPYYMSPEQAEGKAVDTRSDIYSLGCILYEMLTGKKPFEADSSVALIHKHIKETPQPPSQLNPQISPSLEKIVLKCMEKNPQKRYQAAEEIVKDLHELVIEPEPFAKPSKLPKKHIISFAAVLVVLIGLVIFFAVRKMKLESPAIAAPGKKSIAIMYFRNNTGDESLDHWRRALSDLLIADLTQSKYLSILSGDNLFNIHRQLNLLDTESYSSEDLKKVAARAEVDHILLGNYAKAGDTFRINIILKQISTGETIGSERVEGRGEESIFPMVDDLTKRIKAYFELSTEQIANDIDKDVGKITTSSPEAYKYYSEGRKYNATGDNRRSIQCMEKAVTIDPEFAMAYIGMATAYYNMGYEAENKKYLQKALELADRLPDSERFHIQGNAYLQSEKTWGKAIEVYKKLLQFYPNDLAANNNLGVLYWNLEKWDEAIERFEVCIKSQNDSPIIYENQACLYMCRGSYDKAQRVLEYYLNNFSDNPDIYISLSDNYLCQGKYNLALDKAQKAISLNPDPYENFKLIADIYHLRGDLIEAEKEYQKLLELEEPIAHIEGRNGLGALCLLQGKFDKAESHFKKGIEEAIIIGEKEWKSGFHSSLAYLHLKSGNPEKALEECSKAWDAAAEREFLLVQRYTLHYKALSLLEMNSIDKTTKTAEELKKLIEQGLNKKYLRYYYHLIGMMEFKRQNFPQAIEYFKKALSLLPYQNAESWILHNRHALFIEPLASAYHQAGNIEKAQAEYEKIISLTLGRLFYGDIYAKSYYMLGKIYQQKGWEGKAIEHYEKFLDLWKDADPDITELTDAKRQLAALQTQ